MSGTDHKEKHNLDEQQEIKESKSAEHLTESIKGFYLTDPFNQQIEQIRLKMRDESDKKLGLENGEGEQLKKEYGKEAYEVILDARVTEQLRKKLKDHKEHHKTLWRYVPGSKEWKHNRALEIKNAARAIKNPLRWYRDDYDEFADEIEHEYGHEADVGLMKKHLSDQLVAGLPASELQLVWGYLGKTGTAPAGVDVAKEFAKLTPLQLSDFKLQVETDPALAPLKTPVINKTDAHHHNIFERFAELRQIEATERTKVLSAHIYDHARLRLFVMNKLKGAAHGTVEHKIFDALEGNLGQHFYDHPDHKKLALLARIEADFETGNRATLLARLEEIKKDVADKLPKTKKEQTDKEKEEAKKIDEYHKKLHELAEELAAKYRKAPGVRDAVKTCKDVVDMVSKAPSGGGGKGGTPNMANFIKANENLTATKASKAALIGEIQMLEEQYKRSGNDLINYLDGDLKKVVISNPTATPPVVGIPQLDKIDNARKADVSTPDQIFKEDSSTLGPDGLPTPDPSIKYGDLATNIIELASNKGNYANDLNAQLKKIKSPGDFDGKLSADHLLFQLNIRSTKDLKDSLGNPQYTEEAQILTVARIATNFTQIDAKNLELFRAGNREIAEGKIKGWKGLEGVWRKTKQQVVSQRFDSSTFRGRDIINQIVGLDKNHALDVFKDLPLDSSLADIRKKIKAHGHISTEALMNFYLQLQDALQSFSVDHHRIVEIADRDWTIEQIALFAEKIHAEIEAREFVHTIAHPHTEEDKTLKTNNKAQFFQKLLNEREESLKKLEAAQLEKIRNPSEDWKVSFLKSLMKEKYGPIYDKLKQTGEELGLTGKELEDYIKKESHGKIAPTILGHLMTGLAVKEAYDIGKGIYEWGKGKLSSAANKAAHHTRDKGGRILGAAWQHLGSPVVDATKKGAHAVKEGASKMIKGTTDFFIGRPLRFFFHERTQRDESGNVTKEEQWSLFKTPKNILKFFAWPFKTVGKGAKKFWDFFDYTPEKAAADKAWAEKRKAEKAAKKAKSGGGGHGGGGGGHH